jgi:hypothetical protein
MAFVFKESDFKKLSRVLAAPARHKGNNIRYELGGKGGQRALAVEIYPNIAIGSKRGNLVSVYTPSSHLQLHFVSGYVVSSLLNEVTFVGEQEGKLSGLIIEKEGGCSLYANVDRDMLSGDFTRLGPEVMLSGIALSLTETILPEKRARKASSR